MPHRPDTIDSTATDVNADPGTVPPLDNKSQQILTALTELREASAADLAAHIGIGYSTTTPKLRNLHSHGLAETAKAGDGRTMWRLTDAGTAHAAGTGSDTADHDPEDHTGNNYAAGGSEPDDDPTAETAAADTEPADNTSADTGTAHHVTTPDDATEDLVATVADSAEAAVETAIAVQSGDTGQDPPGENGNDAADQTPNEAINGDTPDGGSGPANAISSDAAAETDAAATAASDGADTATAAFDGADTATAASDGTAPSGATNTGLVRRGPGSLDRAVLTILQARPGAVLKVGELCKLINKAEEGTGVSKASPGAVVLAARRLVGRKQAVLAVEKPESFQYLPGIADHPVPAAQPEAADTEVVDAAAAD